MNFFELAEKRRSIRSYRPDPVEDSKLQKILEAARIAPTARNSQPFKILVIRTEGREEELKQIYNKDWFVAPPYILCVCSITDKCWLNCNKKSYGDVDAAIVMDHIILASAELGIGTCWIGAFDPAAAKRVLNIDDTMEPIVFTPLGYAKDTPAMKARKPLDELVIYI